MVLWNRAGVNGIGSVGPAVFGSVNSTLGNTTSVYLGNGAAYNRHVDIVLPLNGIDWIHDRKFSSISSSSLAWQGTGWWGTEMIKLTVSGTEGASNVSVLMDPHHTLTFTYSAGAWTCDDGFPYSLIFTSGSDEYTMTRVDGYAYTFHDKDHSNSGKLKRIEDAFDNDWVFTYDGSGKLTDIVIDVVDGNDHKITYSYFTSGDNNGLLQASSAEIVGELWLG